MECVQADEPAEWETASASLNSFQSMNESVDLAFDEAPPPLKGAEASVIGSGSSQGVDAVGSASRGSSSNVRSGGEGGGRRGGPAPAPDLWGLKLPPSRFDGIPDIDTRAVQVGSEGQGWGGGM